VGKPKIILFDFDGVIVDGIHEYWYSSVKACKEFLNSHEIYNNRDLELSETFVEMRPWVKYGWEMVLITHQIIKKNDPLNNNNKADFIKNYSLSCEKILKQNSWKSDDLQKYLDKARESQISSNFEQWINLYRPFKEVISFIKKAQECGLKIGIITTKKKKFTSQILKRFDIFPELIFGYESGTKIETLNNLMNRYEIKGFIEDRKKTLMEVVANEDTRALPCFLADWGYLKNTDRVNLPKKIKLIKLKDLKDLLANLV